MTIQHTGPISGIAAHGSTWVATAGYDNQVVLWDHVTRTPLARAWHDHLANQVAFSPDGHLLVTASSDYSARIWSVPDLRLVAVLADHEDDVEMAVFSPDGSLVATASRDHRVRLFGLDGRVRAVMAGHTADVISVAWSTEGDEVISSSDDGTVKRWAVATGVLVDDIDLGGVETDTVVVLGDGTVLAGNDAGQVLVVANGSTRAQQAHASGIKRLVHDPERSLLLSLSYDRFLRLWHVADSALELVAEAALESDVWARSAAFAGGTDLVFATFGARYRTFDISEARWPDEEVPPTGGVNAVCPTPRGVFSVGDAGIVRLDEAVASVPGSLCNFLTPVDDDTVVTGGQLGQVIEALGASVLHQHRSPLNCAVAFGVADRSRVVVGAYTGEGVVLERTSGGWAHVADVPLHANAVKGLAVSGDLLFSVCADTSVAWHRLDDLSEVARIEGAHDRIANGCASLGDGWFASVGRDLRLRIWSPDRTVESVVTPHTHSIKCVAASADGRFVATGSYDGVLATYDLVDRRWSTRRATAAGISSLAWDSVRSVFWASSYDGGLHVEGLPVAVAP